MGKNLEPKLELLEKKLLVSVKTDLKNTYFKKFYNDFFKLPIPKPLKFVLSENYMVCWMSYDEILIIADLKLRNDLLKKFDTFTFNDLSLSIVINLPFLRKPSARHNAE